MSEQQNLQVVKECYAAFGRGDIQSILNACSTEIEWITPGESFIPAGGTHRGRDGVGRFFQTVAQTMDFAAFEPRTYVAQGDLVVALGYYRGKDKETGKTFESDWAMLFSFRDGKVAKFQEYTNTAAIAAAHGVALAA
ncbi:MAG TPA: nuclear transport factor 2 family protein [Terriglobales bacterium]|nr:nuclear transport factor 2 family protein [Terriglobales bacterium]